MPKHFCWLLCPLIPHVCVYVCVCLCQEEALAVAKGDQGRKSRELHTSVLRDVQTMFDGKSSEELGRCVRLILQNAHMLILRQCKHLLLFVDYSRQLLVASLLCVP
jgi:hypothetical protein